MDVGLRYIENEKMGAEFDLKILRKILSDFQWEVNFAITFPDYIQIATGAYRWIVHHSSNISDDVIRFYRLLEQNHYNMKLVILDTVSLLGNLRDACKNSDVIHDCLYSPYIQDISFNGSDMFCIMSEQLGDFPFYLATSYFGENSKIMNYLGNTQLAKYCHKHTEFMADTFPDFYSITSICPAYFIGKYYHSYTYDKDSNKVINFCSNSVWDKEDFDKLFEPREVSVILNRDFCREWEIVNSKIECEDDRFRILNIAFYKSFLESIGYDGSLEDAPCVKKL